MLLFLKYDEIPNIMRRYATYNTADLAIDTRKCLWCIVIGMIFQI
jgi:hypothetical protein